MNQHLHGLAGLDRLIHEPARLMIMVILEGAGEAGFVRLQRETGLTQGNLSSHLAKLEDAGYVDIQKGMQNNVPLTTCRLTAQGREAFNGYSRTLSGALSTIP